MKNSQLILKILGLISFLVGLVFSITRWPGGNELLIFSLLAFAGYILIKLLQNEVRHLFSIVQVIGASMLMFVAISELFRYYFLGLYSYRLSLFLGLLFLTAASIIFPPSKEETPEDKIEKLGNG